MILQSDSLYTLDRNVKLLSNYFVKLWRPSSRIAKAEIAFIIIDIHTRSVGSKLGRDFMES